MVAPHAGAWIETRATLLDIRWPSVAPHAGAWIETPTECCGSNPYRSHPMRVRGLKLN